MEDVQRNPKGLGRTQPNVEEGALGFGVLGGVRVDSDECRASFRSDCLLSDPFGPPFPFLESSIKVWGNFGLTLNPEP